MSPRGQFTIKKYQKPVLTKYGNLKNLTAEWQCSGIDSHSHQHGHGHQSHGNGHGYGHCK